MEFNKLQIFNTPNQMVSILQVSCFHRYELVCCLPVSFCFALLLSSLVSTCSPTRYLTRCRWIAGLANLSATLRPQSYISLCILFLRGAICIIIYRAQVTANGGTTLRRQRKKMAVTPTTLG